MRVKIQEISQTAIPRYETNGNVFTLKITDKFKWLTLPVKIIPLNIDNSPLNLNWTEYSGATPYVVLSGVSTPKSISISVNDFGCLVTDKGKIVCFGNNDQGQCNIPPEVNNQNVKQISCGYNHTVALLESGTVIGWGATGTGMGKYGTETIMGQITAAGLTVYKIDAGAEHALALLSNGDVVAWGKNEAAQLSDPDRYWTWPGFINPSWAGGYHPQSIDGFKYYPDQSARPNNNGTGRQYRCGINGYDSKRYNGCESLNVSLLPQHYLWTSSGITTYPHNYVLGFAGGTGWSISTGAPYDYQFSRATTNDPTNVNYGGGGWTAAPGGTLALGTSSKKYTDISAGRSHNLLLAQDGKIELWGDNFYYNVTGSGSHNLAYYRNCPYGQCYVRAGSGAGAYDFNLLTFIAEGDNTAPTVKGLKTTSNSVNKIATSYYGNIVIKTDGSVFSWDRNECGECTNLQPPVGITFNFINGAYRHNLGIDINGNLSISGCWVYNDTASSPYTPLVGTNKYVWAGGARDWSGAVLNTGDVLFWGRSIQTIRGFTLYTNG